MLTLKRVDVRPVVVPLRRPIVSRVGFFDEWPLILIDLYTEEGIVGRSYLAPYLKRSPRYIVPAIHDLAEARKGHVIAPFDDFEGGRSALHFVGMEGMSLIAVSGLDMAAWNALAKAAGLPLAVLLGGSLAPVPAYNSNGLWLTPLDTLADEASALVAEGGFTALKLRLGRERLDDDIAAIRIVREAVGDDVKLMCDFNQGLSLGDALTRCHALDGQGLYWFEEPIAHGNIDGYAQLARELDTPVQLGENFYGSAIPVPGDPTQSGGLRNAGPDAHRRGERLDARRRHRRDGRHPDVVAPVPRNREPPAPGHGDGPLAGVAGLDGHRVGRAVHGGERSPDSPRRARQRIGVGRGRGAAPPLGPVTAASHVAVCARLRTILTLGVRRRQNREMPDHNGGGSRR